MIRLLRGLSLRTKLVSLVVFTTAIILLLETSLNVLSEQASRRRFLDQRLAILVDVVGANCTAAVTFDDVQAAEETLAGLRADPHVLAATISRNDGAVFASYLNTAKTGAVQQPSSAIVDRCVKWLSGREREVRLSRTMTLDGEEVGLITIRYDLASMRQLLREQLATLAYLFPLGLALAVALSLLLQRYVTRPIVTLATTMVHVRNEGDFAVRAVHESDDEIGSLVDGFNEMLREIEVRDRMLKEANESLEEEVIARTAELQHTNEELQAVAARERAANQAKSEFLARMSHEIRTPLNGVIGFADMLLVTGLDDEQKTYAEHVRNSGQCLLSLIDDILDFSKIEAGQMPLQESDFSPEMLAFDVLDVIKPRVRTNQIELICDIDRAVPDIVRGDGDKYRQILLNLVGNAVKFTTDGDIEISMDVDADDGDSVLVHTAVRDSGCGIPEAEQGRVFEEFQQADGSYTRSHGGTGLGLAISLRMARLMGGDLWVDSVEGEGSTFHFTARLQRTANEESRDGRAENLAGQQVFVAMASTRARQVVADMVSALGGQVSTEGRVPETIPDDVSALIADAALVADYDATSLPPTIALATLMQGQSKELKSKFAAVLDKPLRRSTLARSLQVALSQAKAEGQRTELGQKEPTMSGADGKDQAHILVAEDNAVNQMLIQALLKKLGHRVELAVDGSEALEKILTVSDPFDLVLMDVQMPVMDGLEATTQIRARGFADLPIVALTAQAIKGDREKCIAAGMNDYLTKPLNRDALIRVIDALLEARG